MRARSALALLLALLIPACAGSLSIPRSQLAGWHAAELGGTRLIGDLGADEMRNLAADLARFDAIFAKLAGWPVASNPSPLAIYLFRNRELGARFGLGRGVGGWAMGTLDGSFITVAISSGQDQDRSILFHEYTHVLLARNQRAPIPRWINEGLASYFMTVSERGDAVVLGATPGMAAARLARHGALPLGELFEASIARMQGDEIADFYATSWALSHYLMSSTSGRRELAAFLKQLAHGVPSGEAQTAAFGRSVDQLGAELAAHVALLARGVPIETAIDASVFAMPDPPSVVALEPGEVAYALGSLALAMVEVGGAEDEDVDPDLARGFLALAAPDDASTAPRVEAAFGEARAVSGDVEGALSTMQAALARAPDDPRVRLHAARVALLRAEAESASGASTALSDAEDQYLRARTLAPESASAWFGMGQTLVRMGRSDDAFAAFETARRFGWSRQLDIALARLHLARGETAQASDLLRPIAQDPHGGPAQKEAAELLKKAHP